ncbi:hypothetical protein TNCT_641331, partial [Trichonephila clavata]
FLLITVIQNVSCRPKGGRGGVRGSSVAIFNAELHCWPSKHYEGGKQSTTFLDMQILRIPAPFHSKQHKYGGRGMGRLYFTSARWAVLSPATKVLILIFCLILGIFLIVGMYRAYVWCTKDPGRR